MSIGYAVTTPWLEAGKISEYKRVHSDRESVCYYKVSTLTHARVSYRRNKNDDEVISTASKQTRVIKRICPNMK